MKLLFDQNLSHKLVQRLSDLFPDSVHIREVGLRDASDSQVWEYARKNKLMIVSKDSDFHGLGFSSEKFLVWISAKSDVDQTR